ncbi:unnamed protein product, partial [Gulo gulo]
MKYLACLKHTVPCAWNVLPLLSAAVPPAVPQRPPPPRSLPWVHSPGDLAGRGYLWISFLPLGRPFLPPLK